MSDLLAKYRDRLAKPENQVTPAPTPISQSEEVKPSNPVEKSEVLPKSLANNPLANLLNKAKGITPSITKPVSPAATKVAESLKAANKAQTAAFDSNTKKVSVEIPPDLFTLNTSIYEIDGFNAPNFISLLEQTYTAIATNEPDLKDLVEKISKNLRQYEELSYLLTPEQINIWFRGFSMLKNTQIITTAKKKSASSKILDVEKEGGLDLRL